MQQLNDFINARYLLIKAVDSFPVEAREEVLFGKWSLKQVLIHISRWDLILSENVVFLRSDKTPPFYGKVDDVNKESVAFGKDWSWSKAYDEFIKSGERAIEEYKQLPTELWERKFWADRSMTPVKLLGIQTKHYEHEHLPEILKVIKQNQ